MTDCNSLATLKKKATILGLTPYAGLYGDRRQRTTWEKLLQSAGELTPLPERPIETPDRAQINWKLAIALFVGAIVALLLLKPVYSRAFPIKIYIQIGVKS